MELKNHIKFIYFVDDKGWCFVDILKFLKYEFF